MSLTVSSNKLKFRKNTSSAWQGLLLQGEVDILDLVYPVGSIYLSVSSTNPGTLFGGTWERIQDTFLLAAGSSYAAGATGGEATHTLTEAEIASHRHSVNQISISYDYSISPGGNLNGIVLGTKVAGGVATLPAPAHDTNSAGGGQAHNNMPPYLAVYVWKRTA